MTGLVITLGVLAIIALVALWLYIRKCERDE